MGDQVGAQHGGGGGARFIRGINNFDAATLASTTGMDLCFQDGFPTQILSGLAGFLSAASQSAWRNRDTVTSKDLFGLVLVDLHWLSWTASSQTTPRPLAGRGQEVIGIHLF